MPQAKCAFMRSSITYLGHRIDAQRLHLLSERVRALDCKWCLTEQQAKEFEESKKLSQLRVHFDLRLEICLTCGASLYCIRVVLSRRWPDGRERPIGFV